MEDTQEELQNYQNNSKRIIRSFGRIKSRKLSDNKNSLLENLFPKYEAINSNSLGKNNCLEIGFGFGDFLFEKAKLNPQISFLGSEPHLNGVVNILAKLQQEPLPNLKISRQDIRELLKNFPDEIFDQVYILFPDPWPKSKHFKRRLINEEFLEFLAKKIKSSGKLTIATDHDSYKTWILAAISNSKYFTWLAESKKDWQIFPNDWIETKYQKKAALEGRVSVIFNLVKNV